MFVQTYRTLLQASRSTVESKRNRAEDLADRYPRVVGLDNDIDQLPASIGKYLDMTSPDHSYIYGDFEICPTEHDIPGHLRRVCLAGAEKLVVQHVQGLRPPFRLLSTWR